MRFNIQQPVKRNQKTNINYGAIGGQNQRDLATRLKPSEAVNIQNYFVTGDGRLVTRQGLTLTEEVASVTPSWIDTLSSDVLVYAYDDATNSKIATYTISTDTSAVINTFTTNRDDVVGVRSGNYYIASDGIDNIGYFYNGGKFINYDNLAVSTFTAGETVTGNSSGATGQIKAIATGVLLLISITGTFENDEEIEGDSSGATADVDGVAYDWYELTSAPTAKELEIYISYIGTFLFAGNLTDSNGDIVDYKIKWADAITDPTVLPFTDWTSSATPAPTDSGVSLYSAGGKLNSLTSHQSMMFAFYDDATFVFGLEAISVDLIGLAQTVVVQQQSLNNGGFSSVSTPKGVFFANENGVHVFTLNSSDNISIEISNILGENKIENLDFTDSQIQWDGKDRIYITCKKSGSSTNNFVLVYDIKLKVWVEFTGWSLKRMTRIALGNKNELYGISSIEGKIYKLFDGYNDEDLPINGRILTRQDSGNNPNATKDMQDIWIEGIFSPSTEIKVGMHKWDTRNRGIEDAKVFWISGNDQNSDQFGFDKTSFGKGYQSVEGVVTEDYFHKGRRPLANFLKYQLELTSSYESPHEYHFISTSILSKRETKFNNFSTSKPS